MTFEAATSGTLSVTSLELETSLIGAQEVNMRRVNNAAFFIEDMLKHGGTG